MWRCGYLALWSLVDSGLASLLHVEDCLARDLGDLQGLARLLCTLWPPAVASMLHVEDCLARDLGDR